jgi:hypothetical protein
MVKYFIYIAVAVLILWSVYYVVRAIRRQLKGQGGCDGACGSCSKDCPGRKPKE